MFRLTRHRCAIILLASFTLASLGIPQEPAPPTKEALDLQNPIEVQTRGPIHEAYAQPFSVQPEPGNAVPKEPPPPVPEEPPDQKPESDSAEWIPGYWAWDAERQDYLWVSGVYRIAPQGRTFVPGYWTQTEQGWRWVAGFWASQQQENVPYTQEPPAPLDNGPSQPAPDDNSTYIPGTWVYRDTRFLWRPGYWTSIQDGRIWIPPHYVWTPNGYLMVEGYWDYPMDARGLIFAPVYFREPLWQNAGWAYRPNYVVNLPAFFDSSFVRCGSFYFGDFYGPTYASLGYRPWYAGVGRYDPIFSYYGRNFHRNNPNWIAGVQQTYAARASGRLAAPPRTLAQQTLNGNSRIANNAPVVSPLNQLPIGNGSRLVRTSPAQLDAQRAIAQRSREIEQNRRHLDNHVAGNSAGTRTGTFRQAEVKSLRMPDLLQTKSASPQVLTFPNDPRRGTVARPYTPSPNSTTPFGVHNFTAPSHPAVPRSYTLPATPHTTSPPAHRSFTPPSPPATVAPPAPQRPRSSAPIAPQHTNWARSTTQHSVPSPGHQSHSSHAAYSTQHSVPSPGHQSHSSHATHSPAHVSAPAATARHAPAAKGGGSAAHRSGGRRR